MNTVLIILAVIVSLWLFTRGWFWKTLGGWFCDVIDSLDHIRGEDFLD